MQKAIVSIHGHWATVDRIFSAIISNLPGDESGHAPDIEYDRTLCVTDDATAVMSITYPEPKPPKPDIPALIRTWHAKPTGENRKALWQAILDHGEKSHDYHKRFKVNGLTYYAATGGALVVD